MIYFQFIFFLFQGEYPDSGLGSEPERESCRDEIGEEDSDESNSPSGTRKLSIIEASTIYSAAL